VAPGNLLSRVAKKEQVIPSQKQCAFHEKKIRTAHFKILKKKHNLGS